MGTLKFLSEDTSNAKPAKSRKYSSFLSAGLFIAPADIGGFEVCPGRSEGCTKACLYNSGNAMRFKSINQARLRKKMLFFQDRPEFFRQVIADIERWIRKANRENKVPVFRMNGTSDIIWEKQRIPKGVKGEGGTLFDLFPDVQFYDYTAIINRLKSKKIPKNYHLTFSAKEDNEEACRTALSLGFNVTVVFRTKKPEDFPATYWGHQVINGDKHDLRFLDPKGGYVVALTSKGTAMKDESGFVKELQSGDTSPAECEKTKVA